MSLITSQIPFSQTSFVPFEDDVEKNRNKRVDQLAAEKLAMIQAKNEEMRNLESENAALFSLITECAALFSVESDAKSAGSLNKDMILLPMYDAVLEAEALKRDRKQFEEANAKQISSLVHELSALHESIKQNEAEIATLNATSSRNASVLEELRNATKESDPAINKIKELATKKRVLAFEKESEPKIKKARLEGEQKGLAAEEGNVKMEQAKTVPPPIQAVLPAFDTTYFVSLSNKPILEDFVSGTLLSDAMLSFEKYVKQMAIGPKEFERTKAASLVCNVLTFQTMLASCEHFQEFKNDPEKYTEKLSKWSSIAAAMGAIKAEMSELDINQRLGLKLMQHLMQGVEWYAKILSSAGKPFDPDAFLRILFTSDVWVNYAQLFVSFGEKITNEVPRDSQFESYKERCKEKGIRWTHSLTVRKKIEDAGFKFGPMVFKRDRCFCPTCKVEVHGWRPWHNPQDMHDMSKH